MNELYTFKHLFSNRISCSIHFEPAIHFDRVTKNIRPTKHWSSEPTNEEFHTIFLDYVEWMHTVNGELSRIIGGDHTYVLQDRFAERPFWEFWVYHANGEKECVAKQYGFFDPSLIGK
jgi:hypothetical protein